MFNMYQIRRQISPNILNTMNKNILTTILSVQSEDKIKFQTKWFDNILNINSRKIWKKGLNMIA